MKPVGVQLPASGYRFQVLLLAVALLCANFSYAQPNLLDAFKSLIENIKTPPSQQATRSLGSQETFVTVENKLKLCSNSNVFKQPYHLCWGDFTFPDGYTYVGMWSRDKRDGLGTSIAPDGVQYFGQWKDGRPERLIKFNANGTVAESGVYDYTYRLLKYEKLEPVDFLARTKQLPLEVAGKTNEQSALISTQCPRNIPSYQWTDCIGSVNYGKATYEGEYKDGVRSGKGTLSWNSGGVISSGIWSRDQFVGATSTDQTATAEANAALLIQQPEDNNMAQSNLPGEVNRPRTELVGGDVSCPGLSFVFPDGAVLCESQITLDRYIEPAIESAKSGADISIAVSNRSYYAFGQASGETTTLNERRALERCEANRKTAAKCRIVISGKTDGHLKSLISLVDFERIWSIRYSAAQQKKIQKELDSAFQSTLSGATSTADTADVQQVASTEEYTPPLTLIEKERLALEAEQSDRTRGDKVGIGQKTNQEEIYRLRAEAEEAKRKQAELEAQLAAVQQSKLKPTLSVNTEGKRVALVIGNAKYKFNPLNNPVNDATDMAASLRSVGFDVIEVKDATLKQMREATRRFADKLEVSDVGLVYYSGHGIEVKGKNYLIPVNADIRREYEVVDQAFDASNLLRMMESLQSGTKKRVNILIVDACRNNDLPKSWRSTNSGLARMDAPAGSFISFATAPGQVASDGQGRNSPYTKHLLNALKQPNVPIEQVFKQVRRNVMDETGGEQVPWENSSLIGDFYFTVAR